MAKPRPTRDRWQRKLALAVSLALVLAPTLRVKPSLAQDGCRTATIATGLVASVRDGRTFVLADGREVRLAGIEPGTDGSATLRRLASGQSVELSRPSAGNPAKIDRYGRIVAFAVVKGGAQTVQQTLVTAGQARVSGRIGAKSCADALLSAESAARAAGRGLWANPNSAPLSSDNLAGLEAQRGHFALVEGTVLSVRESGATIYVNFGRRWIRDFTVTVLKRQRRLFAAAGIDLDKLAGRRIRVRGFIEQRGGPIIAATASEQIELIE